MEGAQRRVGRERDDELAEVARIDVLQGVVARSGDCDVAPYAESLDPVGESQRGVVTANDEGRSNDRELIAEMLLGDPFTGRFQRPVGLRGHFGVAREGRVVQQGDRLLGRPFGRRVLVGRDR